MKKDYKPKEQPGNDRDRAIEELKLLLQIVKKETEQTDQQFCQLKQQIKEIDTLVSIYLESH